MKLVNNNNSLMKFLKIALSVALKSPCPRAQYGAIIVNNNSIIGEGYNSPPRGTVIKKCFKDDLPKNFESDRTCCIHAEQRAIIDVLKNHHQIDNSTLYLARCRDRRLSEISNPYCTICSKLILDVGISTVVVWHKNGIAIYDSTEYNDISFQSNARRR